MTGVESLMNVEALRRFDPYVKEILETATHVALYIFNEDDHEWERTEVEGALFVYSRNGEPYNSIIIMNRLNTKNQVEPVTKGLELQLQEPFLLYRNSKCHIYGIWFYDKEECVRIASILNKLVKESSESGGGDKTASKGGKKTAHRSAANNVDIFSMLSRAQETFETNRGSSSDASSGGTVQNEASTNDVNDRISGPLSTPLGPDVTSQSVMDFFAIAKVHTELSSNTPRDQAKVATPGKKMPATEDAKPLLARLMSHPAAHTLENIEKQQRSVTPTGHQNLTPSNSATPPTTTSNLLNRSKKKSNKIMTQGDVSSIIAQEQKEPNVNSMDANGSSSFLRIQSPVDRGLLANKMSRANVANSIPLASLFAHSAAEGNSMLEDSLMNSPIKGRQQNTSSGGAAAAAAAPTLIPPVMFAASSPAVEVPNRPEPLTRNQLLQAFNYLVKNDQDFVNKLHEAYVKSFGEILS